MEDQAVLQNRRLHGSYCAIFGYHDYDPPLHLSDAQKAKAMTVRSYELTRLDADNFEHLVNTIALKVLGAGVTGFGPGADGGRDGFFEGRAPYPSEAEQWSGRWYLQSKFHAAHLSKDPQKWLLERITQEIAEFEKQSSNRQWPDIWIIATNIDPSGAAETGAFDKARALVSKANPALGKRFHIWGGSKILSYLSTMPDIATYYSDLLTPGRVLQSIYDSISDQNAKVSEIVHFLVATQFTEQQFTKLEQAGSPDDNRPGIHVLFTDLPILDGAHGYRGLAARTLSKSLASSFLMRRSVPTTDSWQYWGQHPTRAKVSFLKGGPGQGKSTISQYICQIQRAAIIIGEEGLPVSTSVRETALALKQAAERSELWPLSPRIPFMIELKNFAQWYGRQSDSSSKRLIVYLSNLLHVELGTSVLEGTLKRAFSTSRWLFVFDGLDEVPGDVKDLVAKEVYHFVEDVLISIESDAAVICTSRPQGYSGQFDALRPALLALQLLSPTEAVRCARPLLQFDRSKAEGKEHIEILEEASKSAAIQQIMTTPLQAHIMAVVVRGGGRPPERRWQLFETFYQVIKRREANRNLPDKKLANLLRQGDQLLKALHNRLGFELHYRAETSAGATTSIDRHRLREIVVEVVSSLQERNIQSTVATLMRATTERLVLVSTPESGESVRFDVRPLQEFFAAEYIYQSGDPSQLADRLSTICGDSHWTEVMHFVVSALIENVRKTDLAAAASILIATDDGVSQSSRELNRRLARGAIMSARLLQEGVLEQDRSVRAQFRSSILTLSGATDAASYLLNIRQAESVNWLREVFVSALRESAEPESIGAAIVLAYYLTDARAKRTEVFERIASSAPPYLTHFFTAVSADVDGTRSHTKYDWPLEIAIRTMLRPDWIRLPLDTVQAAARLLEKSARRIERVALRMGIPPFVASVLAASYAERPLGRDGTRVLDFGVVECLVYKAPLKLRYSKWSVDQWQSLSESGGVMEAVALLLKAAVAPSRTAIDDFLNFLEGDLSRLNYLPLGVRYLVSERLDNLSSDELKADPVIIVHGHGSDYGKIMMDIARDHGDVNWDKAVQIYPFLFLHVNQGFGPNVEQAEPFLKDAHAMDVLSRRLVKQRWIWSSAYSWGSYFSSPHESGRALRKALLLHADHPVLPPNYRHSLYPFTLDLPRESKFLPHIIGAAVSSAGGSDEDFGGMRARASNSLEKFIPDLTALQEVLDDPSEPRRVRAAAAIAYLLRSKRLPGARRVRELLELYEDAEAHWFLPAAGLALLDAVKTEATARDTFGVLLHYSVANYAGRAAAEAALRAWREAPGAPIHTSGDAVNWR